MRVEVPLVSVRQNGDVDLVLPTGAILRLLIT